MNIDKDKYVYFVSYMANEEKENSGFGCTEVLATNPITDLRTIKNISRVIAKEFGFREVIVLNYQLLRVENNNA